MLHEMRYQPWRIVNCRRPIRAVRRARDAGALGRRMRLTDRAAFGAAELGVRYALDASIRRDRRRLRVNMRLIDGHTGFYLWAESLKRPSNDP